MQSMVVYIVVYETNDQNKGKNRSNLADVTHQFYPRLESLVFDRVGWCPFWCQTVQKLSHSVWYLRSFTQKNYWHIGSYKYNAEYTNVN
jgi:hypothetical protein